jgi:hypothetical protein
MMSGMGVVDQTIIDLERDLLLKELERKRIIREISNTNEHDFRRWIGPLKSIRTRLAGTPPASLRRSGATPCV